MNEFDPTKNTEARLYYEAHVTVEPVFEADLARLGEIAGRHGFRVADLHMRKRKQDTPQRSQDDTFMTARAQSSADIVARTTAVVRDLKAEGFAVWRYKIEDTVLDSRTRDTLGLL